MNQKPWTTFQHLFPNLRISYKNLTAQSDLQIEINKISTNSSDQPKSEQPAKKEDVNLI